MRWHENMSGFMTVLGLLKHWYWYSAVQLKDHGALAVAVTA